MVLFLKNDALSTAPERVKKIVTGGKLRNRLDTLLGFHYSSAEDFVSARTDYPASIVEATADGSALDRERTQE
jgi:hypothetical protein